MGQAEEEDVDTKRLCRDFHNLMKTVGSFSGGQVKLLDWKEEDLGWFKLEIKPSEGLYHGGTFIFKVFTQRYPAEPPIVICETRLYHPNIDTESDSFGEDEEDPYTNVCVSLLGEDWEPNFTFEDCIQSLLFLFYEPNIDDPLSPLIESGMDEEDFATNVKMSLMGRLVDDSFPFDRNYYLDDFDEQSGGEGDVVLEMGKDLNGNLEEENNRQNSTNEAVSLPDIGRDAQCDVAPLPEVGKDSKTSQEEPQAILTEGNVATAPIYKSQSSVDVTDASNSIVSNDATLLTLASPEVNCDNSTNDRELVSNLFETGDKSGAISNTSVPEEALITGPDGPLLDQGGAMCPWQICISVAVNVFKFVVTQVIPELYKS